MWWLYIQGILEGNWQLTDRDRYEELGMRKLIKEIKNYLNLQFY